MQLLAHLPLLSLMVTATAGLQLLQYDIPDELLALFGAGNDDSAVSSSSPAASSAASCIYPASFTLSNFTTWSPATNASLSYVSFGFADSDTRIATSCEYNASSQSLTAGTGLAARYACDNSVVSFIWQKGRLTAIEATCPGQTTTKYEASGSITPTGLQCSATNCTDGTGLGHGRGTLCLSTAPLSANYTSQEPSPLQS